MNITIKTKDLELTPALEQWVREKIGGLGKFLVRYEENSNILCEVEISRSTNHHHKGDVFHAEVNMQLPDKLLRVALEHSDARTALDMVRDRLQREILRYKDKKGFVGGAMRKVGFESKRAMRRLLWWKNKDI